MLAKITTIGTKIKGFITKIKSAIVNIINSFGTLNIILICVFVFFIWFNNEMLELYRMVGDIPETYACAVIAATIGECGLCGWIRTNKDKHRDRKWQIEDMKLSEKENGKHDIYIIDSGKG